MNIHSLAEAQRAVEGVDDSDLVSEVTMRQLRLHEKYQPIEARTGTGYGVISDREFDIHERMSQVYVKEMAQRVIEELSESHEAYARGDSDSHVIEELADATLFYVELCIVCRVDMFLPVSLRSPVLLPAQDSYAEHMWDATHNLMLACNTLKQRPWKETVALVDIPRFENRLRAVGPAILKGALSRITSPAELLRVCLMKQAVNTWRIETNY